jgi:hypothetical protein
MNESKTDSFYVPQPGDYANSTAIAPALQSQKTTPVRVIKVLTDSSEAKVAYGVYDDNCIVPIASLTFVKKGELSEIHTDWRGSFF